MAGIIFIISEAYHRIIFRYTAAIHSGLKNPLHQAVAADISGSFLKQRAEGSRPAKYWSKEEQESRLIAAYTKYEARGDVWSAAASKVSANSIFPSAMQVLNHICALGSPDAASPCSERLPHTPK